jgi:hypothetical protein
MIFGLVLGMLGWVGAQKGLGRYLWHLRRSGIHLHLHLTIA